MVCGIDIVRIKIFAGLILAFGSMNTPTNTIEVYSTTGGGTLLPYTMATGGYYAAAVAIHSFYYVFTILQGLPTTCSHLAQLSAWHTMSRVESRSDTNWQQYCSQIMH